MRALFLVAAALLAMAVNFLVWWAAYRPVTVGLAAAEPPRSISFAPFHRGQSPLVQVYPTPAQIEGDLKALSGRVRAVRTYTSLEGMEIVPRLAGKYDLKVTHSAWLGTRPVINAQEISALIDAANRYPDTVERIIVGNEVLLRKDLTQRELINYIRAVRSAVKQPVSYADVWERWIENPALAEEVDFVTVHILPYWEDHPVGVARARQHVADVYEIVKARFPSKPILIGETGWPTDGRMRNDAAPGLIDHARFIAMFLDLAKEKGFDYNIIEAFDQPWKTIFEGTVGKSWGMLYSDRTAKFQPGAPVSDDPRWLLKFAVSGALAAALILLLGARRKGLVGAHIFVFAFFVQAAVTGFIYGLAVDLERSVPLIAVAGEMFHVAWERASNAPLEALGVLFRYSFYPLRVLGTALWGLLGLLFVLYFVRSIASAAAGDAPVPERVRRVRGTVRTALDHGLRRLWTHRVLSLQILFLVFAGLAIWHVWALVLDGRYRDFPIGNFLAPALVLIVWKFATVFNPSAEAPARHKIAEALSFGRILGLVGHEPAAPLPPGYSRLGPIWGELLLCFAMIGGAVALVIVEGTLNIQAMMWAALCLLMSVPFLATMRLSLALPMAEQPPESFTGKW
jgi:exo-beta-1,3-glucanase (GH17 family)